MDPVFQRGDGGVAPLTKVDFASCGRLPGPLLYLSSEPPITMQPSAGVATGPKEIGKGCAKEESGASYGEVLWTPFFNGVTKKKRWAAWSR